VHVSRTNRISVDSINISLGGPWPFQPIGSKGVPWPWRGQKPRQSARLSLSGEVRATLFGSISARPPWKSKIARVLTYARARLMTRACLFSSRGRRLFGAARGGFGWTLDGGKGRDSLPLSMSSSSSPSSCSSLPPPPLPPPPSSSSLSSSSPLLPASIFSPPPPRPLFGLALFPRRRELFRSPALMD
jgi:hypothetical protein